jgi:hypothetical protein
MYVIEIINSSKKCWIASHNEGDPPRTLVIDNAQTFASESKANDRIKQVKETHPFKHMVYKVRKASNFY